MQDLILKFLGIATALAMEIAPFSTTTPQVSVHYWAAIYNVSYVDLYSTLDCESGFNPNAKGDVGTSIGVAQIHLPDHPDVTRAQALDPNFSIMWTAQQFAKGNAFMWTCHRNQKLGKITAPPLP